MDMRLIGIELFAPSYEAPSINDPVDHQQQVLALVKDCVHMNFC
jgi:hypothetical protein